MIVLVCTTNNREREFNRFIYSLKKQSNQSFFLIVIDQNQHNLYVDNTLKLLKKEQFLLIKSKPIPLSQARNIGLYHAPKSKIVGFPDDDCEYPQHLLSKVQNYFDKNHGMISFQSSSSKAWENDIIEPKILKESAVVGSIISYTIFFDFRKWSNYLLFDEKLGVGNYFGSSEESDYALRFLLKAKERLKKIANTYIYHPPKDDKFYPHREKSYALGTGGFFKKHITFFITKFPFLVLKVFVGPVILIGKGIIFLNEDLILKGVFRIIFRVKGFLIW